MPCCHSAPPVVYSYCINRTGLMTTLIQQVSENSFELTTAKGKTVNVTFSPWGRVNVFVGTGLGIGRMFADLTEAAAAYKSADVRSALEALAA